MISTGGGREFENAEEYKATSTLMIKMVAGIKGSGFDERDARSEYSYFDQFGSSLPARLVCARDSRRPKSGTTKYYYLGSEIDVSLIAYGYQCRQSYMIVTVISLSVLRRTASIFIIPCT